MEGAETASEEATWRVRASHDGVYTGGKLAFSPDGVWFASMYENNVSCVEAATGRLLFRVQREPDTEEEAELAERFTTFCLHPDGQEIVTASDNQLIRCWSLREPLEEALGAVKASIGGEQDQDENAGAQVSKRHAFAMAKSSRPEMLKSWKGHLGPITCADFHAQGDLFATGSSDRTVKVWSMSGGYCTHNFRAHSAVITFVGFHPRGADLRLASGDSSGVAHVWDLMAQTDASESEGAHLALNNHFSAISTVRFSADGRFVFTASRDKVLCVWNKAGKLVKSLAVLEPIEGMVVVPIDATSMATIANDDGVASALANGKKNSKAGKHRATRQTVRYAIAIAGSKGIVRLYCFTPAQEGKEASLTMFATEGHVSVPNGLTGLFLRRSADALDLVATTFDNLIVYLDPKTLQRGRQLIGFNDEILDLKALPGRRVVMATNADYAALVSLDTFDSMLLTGHKAAVLSVDVSPAHGYIVTGSKDNSIRVFSARTGTCIAVGEGHTEAVASVRFLQLDEQVLARLEDQEKDALPQATAKRQRPSDAADAGMHKLSPPVIVSGGADKSLKLWAMETRRLAQALVCKHTEIAHDKAINALATSPNKALVATGSQDRLIKLWNVDDFGLRATLRGHKRGIWDLAFSPVERCLASASADKTIRIWSIGEMACLSVLEGHATSVLRVQYLAGGQHLASAASNGVLKVWALRKGECTGTMEHHDDKVWALTALSPEDSAAIKDNDAASVVADDTRPPQTSELVSGGSDSRLVLWQDFSEQLAKESLARDEEKLLKEQELFASLRSRDYLRAALRALELNRPHQLRTTLETMLTTAKSNEDPMSVASFVRTLTRPQLFKCWELARDWNMYARNATVAHALLEALLAVEIPLASSAKAQAILDPTLAYSERHFQRLDRLAKDSYLLDHALSCMDHLD
ncbi:Transducin beta-like protein 3 [Hondaea fermentalgiana]|uniref:Transducin beta-like protein 3 n=1 Tax=Hondaea fermentalgiana TaxID=2315210 RepID=A0A2R5GUS4_9STRA|nr:Transducin beta-like protein 3 [Hondaea fermentalgiana]|eukprot:GBG34602.1 Transducin beta-like protein 3 [Hondaea fermentalgiana]